MDNLETEKKWRATIIKREITMLPSYCIAILSDIHGNETAVEAVMADLGSYPSLDRVIVTSDIICGPGQARILRSLYVTVSQTEA